MRDAESKRTLENALGKLLGFEEGEAEDLLEHLFTIESDGDLSEYLLQLLGGQTQEMDGFVQNMSRYRNGELITTNAENDDNDGQKELSKKASTASSSQDTAAFDSFRAMAIGNNNKTSKKSAGRKNTKQNQGSKSRVPPPKNVNKKNNPPPPNTSTGDGRQNLPSSSSSFSQAQNPPLQQSKQKEHKHGVVEKSRPSRGKAKIVCGCFGTKHKALTNCLYCGRISCEAEGYDFCAFCGFMVEVGIDGDGKAFLQKERLLRFDRDFARRTEVFDDQADYQTPSAWMTEEEKDEADENQLKHLESLRRSKQTLLKLAI